MYSVRKTDRYEKMFYKLLSTHEQKEITEFHELLAMRPYLSKPLKSSFFREKKIDGKIIHYLIYDEFQIILMVNISTKKTQQEIIDEIIAQRELHKEYVRQLVLRDRA